MDDRKHILKRGQEFLQLHQRIESFAQELLKENERLRYRAAGLEQEKKSLQASVGGAAPEDLLRKIESLEKEREELLQRYRQVEEENVDFANRYLEIEKMRFNDKLDFSLEMDPALENMQIPRFLIQPLVENSIKHGISKITKKGVVNVTVKQKDNNLVISVRDNGPDFPDDLLSGYGLQSIYDKLDLLYPDRYKIQMHNGNDKNITITLEMNEEK